MVLLINCVIEVNYCREAFLCADTSGRFRYHLSRMNVGRSVYASMNVLTESLNKTLRSLSHSLEAFHGAERRAIRVTITKIVMCVLAWAPG